MSTRKNFNNNNKKTSTPYCKVCHDAGKSEREYTSHFVRSTPGPSGTITCPTLLATRCRYCDQAGHTVSFCRLSEQSKRTEEKIKRESAFRDAAETQLKPVKKVVANNAFAALDSDDDDAEEFPALAAPPKLVRTETNIGYLKKASVRASLEAPSKAPVQEEGWVKLGAEVPFPLKNMKASAMNWADWDDEEDDYDDLDMKFRSYRENYDEEPEPDNDYDH